MSRNIKEIGKELMGKSLNSFHRKTGLTQLEKNNEMQDGILDGILSQVDDAYIEKTEQSNVIHLDGSGDGVVVLDSIEGNTMVNLLGSALDDTSYYTKNSNGSINIIKHDTTLPPFKNENHRNLNLLKPNTKYTLIVNGDYTKVHAILRDYKIEDGTSKEVIEILNRPLSSNKTVFTTYHNKTYIKLISSQGDSASNYPINNLFVSILEGDWTNKEIPSMFEGLQSSFEENLEDDKYKIEILSCNRNLGSTILENGSIDVDSGVNATQNDTVRSKYYIPIKPNTKLTCNTEIIDGNIVVHFYDENKKHIRCEYSNPVRTTTPTNARYLRFWSYSLKRVKKHYIYETDKGLIEPKQNKIKLLINEPLRATDTVKDKMCIKDNRLVVERNCGEVIFNGEENWQDDWQNLEQDAYIYFYLTYDDFGNYAKHPVRTESVRIVSDYFYEAYCNSSVWVTSNEKAAVHTNSNLYYFQVSMLKSKLSSLDKQGFKNFIKLRNGLKFVYKLAEPYYEEVTNEYGEPILLEGYENGTIYIDSTIIPTTTVRYTPKMESFKTLNEVSDNNTMLTNDINDNIIPYLMDVDLMIMEKEMALMSHKNIRTIGVKDMTSMQKRTQDTLERLIKGKTLTEQECKTRVTTYLNAGKITDAQAEELNFLIDEIYA